MPESWKEWFLLGVLLIIMGIGMGVGRALAYNHLTTKPVCHTRVDTVSKNVSIVTTECK